MTTLTSVDTVAVSAAAGAAVTLVTTLLVVPLTIRLARRLGVVDEPGARSSHVVATPRLGGIGVAAGALAGLLGAAALDPSVLEPVDAGDVSLGVVVGVTALLFGAIGLADDLLRGIPVSVRLAAQLAVGGLLVAPWAAVHLTDRGTATTLATLVLAAAAGVWVIGYVNVFNFMDGVDGISGFVAVVVGLDLALVGALDDRSALVVIGLVLAGAAAGFLPSNLRPATVFLGDGGSYFLGAWIATAAVVAIGLDTPPEAVLAVAAPYLADASVTLVRRVARRADWRASHHEHAYQQLIEQGRSHRSVAATVAGASALCAVLGLVSLTGDLTARAGAAAAIVAVAAAYVALPTIVGRRRIIVLAPAPDELVLDPDGEPASSATR